MCFILKKFFAQSRLSSLCNITAHSNLQNTITQGAYPFHETNFQDLEWFSRALMLLHYLDLNINSPYCLPYTSFFYKILWFYALGWQWELATVKRFKSWCFKHLVELTHFINFAQPVAFFPQLSSPAKCHKIIPGLSRFSRTCANLARRYPCKTPPN